jgi:hypothetical protein
MGNGGWAVGGCVGTSNGVVDGVDKCANAVSGVGSG